MVNGCVWFSKAFTEYGILTKIACASKMLLKFLVFKKISRFLETISDKKTIFYHGLRYGLILRSNVRVVEQLVLVELLLSLSNLHESFELSA